MELFRLKGVTGLPDNFPIQHYARLLFNIKLKRLPFKKPIFLLNGEVILQASDSSLSKELYKHAVNGYSGLLQPGRCLTICRPNAIN